MDILIRLFLCLICATCLSCSETDVENDSIIAESLDEAFRIDISSIDVVYDVEPTASTFEGRAEIHFVMRAGQSRALFHFEPKVAGVAQGAINSLALNGEVLDVTNEDDFRVIQFSGSSQNAYELVRELASGIEHSLQLSWTAGNILMVLGSLFMMNGSGHKSTIRKG